jgi:hypothetical protein
MHGIKDHSHAQKTFDFRYDLTVSELWRIEKLYLTEGKWVKSSLESVVMKR